MIPRRSPLVPQTPILVGQGDRVTGGVGACRGASRGEQQEGKERKHLGLVGHQLDQQAGQPNRLGLKVDPGHLVPSGWRVCLGGDQVHHRLHRRQPVGELGVGGDGVGDMGGGDLGSGPHQPLGHGRLWHQECPGDGGDLEPGQGAKRQGDLDLAAQRRVAAGEDQAQHVVLQRALRFHRLDHLLDLVRGGLGSPSERLGLLGGPGRFPPQHIERFAPSDDGQPCPGAVWDPSSRPGVNGGDGGLGEGVLGDCQVAELSGPRWRALSGPPSSAPRRGIVGGAHGGRLEAWTTGAIGRSSILPRQAAGICAAQAIASSRSAVSSTKYPPRTSFASA